MKIVIIVLKQHKQLISISTSNSGSVTTCISEVYESTVFSWSKLVNIVNRIKILRKHIMSNFLICFHCRESALCNRRPSIKQQYFVASHSGQKCWLWQTLQQAWMRTPKPSSKHSYDLLMLEPTVNYFFEMVLVGNISGKVKKKHHNLTIVIVRITLNQKVICKNNFLLNCCFF